MLGCVTSDQPVYLLLELCDHNLLHHLHTTRAALAQHCHSIISVGFICSRLKTISL